MRRIQPYPWRVEYLQYSQTGKRSRPRIVDHNGKTVRLSNPTQATLAALAPELLDALDRLLSRAEMLHMQIQSALGFNTPTPQEIVDAATIVNIARRGVPR